MHPVDELVYQQMIADQEVGFHGSGWNLEGLHHKSGREKGDDGCNDDGFEVFPDCRLAELGLRVVHYLCHLHELKANEPKI